MWLGLQGGKDFSNLADLALFWLSIHPHGRSATCYDDNWLVATTMSTLGIVI